MKKNGRNSQKSSVHFPRIHRAVTLSKHCISRMKQRAKLNTKEKRKRFLKIASEECLMLHNIPRVEQFEEFIAYMKGVIGRVKRKNLFSYAYLYSDYFLIIASDGKAITLINVDPEYRGGYNRIRKYLKEEQENNEIDSINRGDDIMSP